jgi:hypothetical protein
MKYMKYVSNWTAIEYNKNNHLENIGNYVNHLMINFAQEFSYVFSIPLVRNNDNFPKDN